jgi:hypothetical protein
LIAAAFLFELQSERAADYRTRVILSCLDKLPHRPTGNWPR